MSPLALLEVWASFNDTARTDRQVGLVYNFGIWMSVTPKSWLRDDIANGTDLPPINVAYSGDPGPIGMVDGSVRGHSAWVYDMSTGGSLNCSGVAAWGTTMEPSPSSAPTPSPTNNSAVYYQMSEVSQLVWMENGVLIHLTGPYSLAVLSQLASGISFG